MREAMRTARWNVGSGVGDAVRPLLAWILALAIAFVGLPSANPGAAAAPADVGVSAGDLVVLLAGPPPVASVATGAPKWQATAYALAVRTPLALRRARPVGRTAVRRGRAQRWFAKRLLDGG